MTNEHYLGFDVEIVGTTNPVDGEPKWAVTILEDSKVVDARYVDADIPLSTVLLAFRRWVDDRRGLNFGV